MSPENNPIRPAGGPLGGCLMIRRRTKSGSSGRLEKMAVPSPGRAYMEIFMENPPPFPKRGLITLLKIEPKE